MTTPNEVMTADQLLHHWQAHRGLTRRTIEAFPEKELFEFSIGGMRPFKQLVQEMIDIAIPGVEGIATRKWAKTEWDHTNSTIKTKAGLLAAWDEVTDIINEWWPKIPEGRFQERDVAYGQYEGPIYWTLLYAIDNEIHHRGQGYVYLRALGIEPPPFWDRNA